MENRFKLDGKLSECLINDSTTNAVGELKKFKFLLSNNIDVYDSTISDQTINLKKKIEEEANLIQISTRFTIIGLISHLALIEGDDQFRKMVKQCNGQLGDYDVVQLGVIYMCMKCYMYHDPNKCKKDVSCVKCRGQHYSTKCNINKSNLFCTYCKSLGGKVDYNHRLGSKKCIWLWQTIALAGNKINNYMALEDDAQSV